MGTHLATISKRTEEKKYLVIAEAAVSILHIILVDTCKIKNLSLFTKKETLHLSLFY